MLCEKTEITGNEEILSGYDLIIFDEVHRAGAETWEPLVAKIINNNSNAKILAMTATPERKDKKTPIDTIAETIYGTKNGLFREQYMAAEIYLEDALRDGLVVNPISYDWDIAMIGKKSFSNYLEKISLRFKEINNDSSLTSEEKKEEKKKIIEPIFDSFEENNEYGNSSEKKLNTLIKFNQIFELGTESINGPVMREYMMLCHKYKTSSKNDKNEIEESLKYLESKLFDGKKTYRKIASSMQNKRIELLKKAVVNENDGIYIASIDNFSGLVREFYKDNNEYIESEKKRIRYELSQAFGKEVTVHYADDKNEIDKISKDKKEEEEKGEKKVHIVLSKKLLDEGIHMDGTKGVFMYSKTNSEIVYSQRIGRTIHSSDSLESSERPIVVDFAGNKYNYLVDNYSERFSPEYDLLKLQEICDWIKENGNLIPDVNKEYNDDNSKEIRYGLILKNLINRYSNMNNFGFNKSIDEIKKTINSLNEQYNITLTSFERNGELKPTEKEILGQDFFELTPSQQIVKDYSEEKEFRNNDNYRIKKLLNILDILKKYKKDIVFPYGFSFHYFRKNEETKKMEDVLLDKSESVSLYEFLQQNFSEDEISEILKDLTNYTVANEEFGIDAQNKKYTILREKNGVIEDYDMGKELAYVRGLFLKSGIKEEEKNDTENEPPITKYSLETLKNLGITRMSSELDITQYAIVYDNNEKYYNDYNKADKAWNNTFGDLFELMGFKTSEACSSEALVKGLVLVLKEDGFEYNKNRCFYCYRRPRKNSKNNSQNYLVRINSKFNNYSWITGIKYGSLGLDIDGKMSQELIYAREFIDKFIYGANEDGSHLDISQVYEIVLKENRAFCDENEKLIDEYKARAYIEKCILYSIKYFPNVFFKPDQREGMKFDGIDSLLNPELSRDKKDRISLLGREFPKFNDEYTKHLDEEIQKEKGKLSRASLSQRYSSSGIGIEDYNDSYEKIKEALKGGERDE